MENRVENTGYLARGIELEGFGPGVEPFCLCRPISLWYAICSTREKTASFILTSAR